MTVRFVPDEPLPPYTFVPGRSPHPFSDPRGHSHGRRPEPVPSFDPEEWTHCRAYLRGIDLFNFGYYWEAHEIWESLWNACGRAGPTADFLKGLIKLAAAGVKMRQGQPRGVAGHAVRAADLFQRAGVGEPFLGLRSADLLNYCRRAELLAESGCPDDLPVRPVFDFVLWPRAEEEGTLP